LFAAAGLAGLGFSAAHAADAVVADSSQVQEIVVTAQKREQKEINVPITITAYTGAFLDKVGVQDLHDVSLRTPGFFLQNQSVNDPGLVMRGITTDSTDPTNEPRVSVYQDGVSISQVAATAIELFDLQRVEVAKGPQTTLFGRSALTGAVNIIQNKASEAGFDWSAHGEVGNYGDRLIEGAVNLPVGDDFAVRFAARVKTRDGYVENVEGGRPLNGVSTQAGRLSFNYHPGKGFNDDFIINYERDDPSGVAFKNATFYPSDPVTGQVLGNLSPYSSAALGSQSPLGPLGIKREIEGATNILTASLTDSVKLTSTTAARTFHLDELFDPDGFSFPLLSGSDAQRGTEFSQDVRLNYDPGGAFSAFGGVSVFGDYQRANTQLVIDEPLALALLSGTMNRANPVVGPESAYTNPAAEAAAVQAVAAAHGVAMPTSQALAIAANLNPNHFEQDGVTAQTLSYDAYLDGTFRPTSNLEFSAGVRYTTDKKETFTSNTVGSRSTLGGVIGAFGQTPAVRDLILNALTLPNVSTRPFSSSFPLPEFGVLYQPTAGNGLPDKASLTDSGLSWRLTGRYTFNPDLNVYATYAHGRRPEVLASDGPSVPFKPTVYSQEPAETLDDYEGGVKARLFGGRLSLDGAVYYNAYNHFSTTEIENGTLVSVDAGAATTYGFEGQAFWAVTPMVDVFATYAYTHGRFDNGVFKGNQFRLTPENVFTAGAALRHHALGGIFELLPNVRYTTKQFFNDDNAKPSILADEGFFLQPLQFNQYQNAYAVADLRLSYAPDRANWKIEGFVTNLTDTQFLKDAGNTGLQIGLPTYIPGEPRFFGASFTIRR
jgi:outer membrane receptor protein involved in Fe transport